MSRYSRDRGERNCSAFRHQRDIQSILRTDVPYSFPCLLTELHTIPSPEKHKQPKITPVDALQKTPPYIKHGNTTVHKTRILLTKSPQAKSPYHRKNLIPRESGLFLKSINFFSLRMAGDIIYVLFVRVRNDQCSWP